MKLSGTDGLCVALQPVRMQFPDAEWLVVQGDVSLPDGRVWAFEDPCLTVSEARSMSSWLRAVGMGSVQPTPFEGDNFHGLEWYTEPNLGLSLAEFTEVEVTLRVHFSLESLPPWRSDDNEDVYSYFELVRMALADVVTAADQWDRELDGVAELA